MSEEIYKIIPEFANYEISNFGNIRRFKSKKPLTPSLCKKTGYLMFDFCQNGNKYRKLVHRIVLSTFVENIENKEQLNHINGIKSDNRLNNLEWNTRSENQKHSILIGLRHARGNHNSQCKLTEEQVLKIFNDERKYKYISNEFNISISTVADIKRGYSWTHITKLDNIKKSIKQNGKTIYQTIK